MKLTRPATRRLLTLALCAGSAACGKHDGPTGGGAEPPAPAPTPSASSVGGAAPSGAPSSATAAPSSATSATSAASAAAASSASSPPEAAAPTSPELHPDRPRIYALARFTWIQAEPRQSEGWIGFLSRGGSVALRADTVEKARVYGPGCKFWYAIEPRGYVCEGDAATLDPKHPTLVALQADAPKLGSPWPYDYGESLGAPRWDALPTAKQKQRKEWYLADHLRKVEEARAGKVDDSLLGVDVRPAGTPAPALHPFTPLMREARPWIATGSTVAWTRSFDDDGRTYVYTADKTLVPKDRVRVYPRAEFHGVELDGEASLPLAFFRKTDRPKYRRSGDGFAPTGEVFPRLSHVGLTGEELPSPEGKMLATKEPGIFVRTSDAVVVRSSMPPWGDRPKPGGGRETWVEVSVLGGWLLALEGRRPVYATMISPGRGGLPLPGVDPIETAATPVGNFRVDGKFLTATMVSSTNSNLVHTDVQYVQNFHGAHSLHGAYWHDVWGEKKSGGCVNLSPRDSLWMFAWTEPPVPAGWYGIRSIPEAGPATTVVVHE